MCDISLHSLRGCWTAVGTGRGGWGVCGPDGQPDGFEKQAKEGGIAHTSRAEGLDGVCRPSDPAEKTSRLEIGADAERTRVSTASHSPPDPQTRYNVVLGIPLMLITLQADELAEEQCCPATHPPLSR